MLITFDRQESQRKAPHLNEIQVPLEVLELSPKERKESSHQG